jgi:endogenous inhibitor of DNA gyrase (YacG/DUF329 family)
MCKKPVDAKYRPFCSKRCADVDLARWMKGSYVIPGSAESDEDGDASSAAPFDENVEAEVNRPASAPPAPRRRRGPAD